MTDQVFFPAQSSVLDAGALSGFVAANYDLPGPVSCRLVSRSVNDTYRVMAANTPYYLRVYRHDWRAPAEVDGEITLALDLHGNGVPVAPAVKRRNGHSATYLPAPEGVRPVVLWQAAPGVSVRDISTRQAGVFGALAAQLHSIADQLEYGYRRFQIDETHLIDEPMGAIRRVMRASPTELADLERFAERVRSRLADLPRTIPDYGICHGDLHPGNARFEGDSRATLFGFDNAGYGWRGYDVTGFLWNMYVERRPRRWREQRWIAFLRRYQETRPLPEDFDTLVPYFLVARQIWRIGLDCSGQTGYPPQWLTPDYFRAMVDVIRRWSDAFPALGVQRG